MPDIQLLVGLVVAVALLTTLARQLHVAYPILLVLGGLVLSFMPGVPSVALPPNLVLLLFLPPLLYVEAINLSFRDLLHSARPVLSLAVGLVLATIVAVALVAHTVIGGFTWATAFVLGTIVAPTDEVAAGAIAERLVVPARLVAIIEDESLLNDAISLVAYNVAVAAVVSGTFSLTGAGIAILVAGLGGIAVGVAVGWLVTQLRRLDDPPVEVTISLLTGYAAYLPADALHLSGVLAVVACGMYMARRGPRIISPGVRLQSRGMWEIVNFLLNGVLFILVGLQLHSILSTLAAYPPARLLLYALVVILTVVLLRIAWSFSTAVLPSLFSRAGARPPVPIKETAVVAWTGMRGAVSLAAALAIPFVVAGGGRFPNRELIIYLTYAVILSTLVLQGLTLPLLIRRLGIAVDPREQREEVAARLAAVQAGLQSLNSSAADGIPPDLVDSLRRRLEATSRRVGAQAMHTPDRAQQIEVARYRRMLRDMLNAERNAVIELRDQGIISDDVMRRVERELDLEEVRWESLGVES